MRRIDKAVQQKLHELGLYFGEIDGLYGKQTTAAVRTFQKMHRLYVDGEFGPQTRAVMFGFEKPTGDDVTGSLNRQSLEELKHAHPELQRLILAAVSEGLPIQILDSRRGKKEQEEAFKRGTSKVHFGDSAHNWDPSVALDIVPDPLSWSDLSGFKRNYEVIGFWNPATNKGHGLAKTLKIPIRCLADPNMDGNTRDGWDWPHYELTPWRMWAVKSQPYRG